MTGPFDQAGAVEVRFVVQDPVVASGRGQIVAGGVAGQSLLEIALAAGIGIEHTCGGVCACSTCHVWVREGMEHLTETDDREQDVIDQAPEARPYSRLACQARIAQSAGQAGRARVLCEVPAWNRNAARGHE